MFLNPAQIFPSSDDNFSFSPSAKASPENPCSFWNRGSRILPLDEILLDSQQQPQQQVISKSNTNFESSCDSLDSFFEELSKTVSPVPDEPYPFLEGGDNLTFDFPAEPIYPPSSHGSNSSLSGISSRQSIDPNVFNYHEAITPNKEPDDDLFHHENTSTYFSSKPSAASGRSKGKFYSRSGQVADPTRGPCHNCRTTLTCYWRKLKGQYHCNACTLYYKRNHCHRSVDEINKPIKRRNRKPKYDN